MTFEPKTAGDLLKSLESLVKSLKELPPDAVVRQYLVSEDGNAAQVVSKYTFIKPDEKPGEENKDPYYKLETYCEEDISEIDDDIEMIFLKESDLLVAKSKKDDSNK